MTGWFLKLGRARFQGPRPGFWPAFSGPLAKGGHFMAVAAGGGAAPLTMVVFGSVVEMEHARGGVGTPAKIIGTGPGQKARDLMAEEREGQFRALQLRG